jgi:hypothetical protein
VDAKEALEKLPKALKIGPHVYTVRLVDGIPGEEGEITFAQIDTSALLIEVIRNCPSSSIVAGHVIHECLHGIWHERNLGKRPDEEKVVLQFESGLIQLAQDNPKFFRWFLKCISSRQKE